MGVCVNSSVNMADFLICVVQRGTAALQAGCSGAAQRRRESLVADGNPRTGQSLLRVRLHLWATGVLLRYAFLPSALAVAPAVALAGNDPLGVSVLQRVDTGRPLPRRRGRDGGDSEVGLRQIIGGTILIQRV